MYCIKNNDNEYYTGGGSVYPGTGAAKRNLWTSQKEYACSFATLEHAMETAKRYKNAFGCLHPDYLSRSGRPVQMVLEKIHSLLNEEEKKYIKDSFIERTLDKEMMKFYFGEKK